MILGCSVILSADATHKSLEFKMHWTLIWNCIFSHVIKLIQVGIDKLGSSMKCWVCRRLRQARLRQWVFYCSWLSQFCSFFFSKKISLKHFFHIWGNWKWTMVGKWREIVTKKTVNISPSISIFEMTRRMPPKLQHSA